MGIMNNTTEEVKKMLLQGRHITKLDLFHESDIHSSCLPQRIYDIRKELGWNIQFRSVPGKGTLREYWLEKEEIERIKGENVPSVIPKENIVPQDLQTPLKANEQTDLFGGISEWW